MNSPVSNDSKGGTTKIARMWRGLTPEEKAEPYLKYLEETGVKDIRATKGNRGVFVLRQVGNGQAEFLFISFWESYDAIRKFAGPEFDKAVYYPQDKEFLLELEPKVRHFEVAAGEKRAVASQGSLLRTSW